MTTPEFTGNAPLPALKAETAGWEESEFALLFRENYPRLVVAAARLVGERSLAEEIAAEALWRLYRRPALHGVENNIPAWLYRTATRLGLDALRSRRRWRTIFDRAAAEPPPSSTVSQHAALELRERAWKVRAVLRRLKPVHAELLLLRHSGHTYLEIAAAKGMKPTSVGATLARAESAFAAAFEKEKS